MWVVFSADDVEKVAFVECQFMCILLLRFVVVEGFDDLCKYCCESCVEEGDM